MSNIKTVVRQGYRVLVCGAGRRAPRVPFGCPDRAPPGSAALRSAAAADQALQIPGAGESPHPPYRVMIARADRRQLFGGHGGLRAQPWWYQAGREGLAIGRVSGALLFGGQAPVSHARSQISTHAERAGLEATVSFVDLV